MAGENLGYSRVLAVGWGSRGRVPNPPRFTVPGGSSVSCVFATARHGPCRLNRGAEHVSAGAASRSLAGPGSPATPAAWLARTLAGLPATPAAWLAGAKNV